MKSIGILSFHGAHNYGSMLQNYALQQAIKSLSKDFEPVTINLRNKAQNDMYNIFKPFKEYQDKRRYLFKILMLPWRSAITIKQNLFEAFLEDKIAMSEQVNCSEYINSSQLFDAYVVGSDQIWNFTAHDFDWAYFLDFIPEGKSALKIAYAPSMGPNPSIETLSIEDRLKVNRLLSKFDFISVREKKTATIIRDLGGFTKNIEVCPDPTLLLDKDKWQYLIEDQIPLRKGKYIFLYNPYFLGDVYSQARRLSELTKLPVVVSNLAPKTILPSKSFEKIIETGPMEFLNLVKNAEYVIGRSFHLAVFAIIFNKKFIAVDGMSDSRIGNFLSQIGMNVCSSTGDNLATVLSNLDHLDYSTCNQRLNDLRTMGLEFLNRSLGSLSL